LKRWVALFVRVSPAMVVAMLALFVALGGVSTAAQINSPQASDSTSAQAAKQQVRRGPRGPRGPRGFRGRRGLRGLTGAAGPQGPQGPQGTQGPAGSPDTPAQVLSKLQEVDGTGSNLDADQIDGLDSSAFPRKIVARSVPWNPGSIAAGGCVSTSVALGPGVLASDHVIATHSESGGTSLSLQQTALMNNASTAFVMMCNHGAAAFDPPAFTLNVLVLR
jgi:Collagen triple helix repeat (20 copies)